MIEETIIQRVRMIAEREREGTITGWAFCLMKGKNGDEMGEFSAGIDGVVQCISMWKATVCFRRTNLVHFHAASSTLISISANA